MENFLTRETGGSTSQFLLKENESKFSPRKEVSTSVKTKETPSVLKKAPGIADTKVPEAPSTSTLKQVTKGKKVFSHVFFLT